MLTSSLTAMVTLILHVLVLLSSMCNMAQAQTSSTKDSLAGTSWQLVKFQSSDDKTITPDLKSKYTLAFGNDGRVSVRLDCNRGSGTYESKGPNQLEFGRLALTLMMCPPGSLHNRIARDLGAVRSYIIKDGHLFLSLMADGAFTSSNLLVARNLRLTSLSLEGNGCSLRSEALR
jgi:heat shock protein HslJ